MKPTIYIPSGLAKLLIPHIQVPAARTTSTPVRGHHLSPSEAGTRVPQFTRDEVHGSVICYELPRAS